jgi:hypothetical protein
MLAGMLAWFAVPIARAQPVLLQIRPHVGDTLSVRLDQQVEMTGVPFGCGVQQGASRARLRAAAETCADVRTMTTRMEVFSRAIARSATRDATAMLAITDSVRTSSGKRASGQRVTNQPTERAPVEIRISTDGGVELISGPASDEMRTLFGQIPATLSRKPVAVGEKWIHEMRVPLAGEPGVTGRVRTTFQLDSLGRNGDIAYISMKGILSHDHSDGSNSETSGSLAGTIRLDRRLSWITDTRATIDVWSQVKSPRTGEPMHVHTKIVQSLWVSGVK